jgi:hypothetical protein
MLCILLVLPAFDSGSGESSCADMVAVMCGIVCRWFQGRVLPELVADRIWLGVGIVLRICRLLLRRDLVLWLVPLPCEL